MSWGAVAVAGATVVGSMVASDAAGSAANAQAGSAAASDATQRYMYDTTRADNAPFLNTGRAANNRLAFLLGIGGSGRSTPLSSLANAPLVSGHSYNPDLYASNDAYRKAWDQLASEHYQTYGTNYNNASDMGWVESHLRDSLSGEIAKDRAAQEASYANDPEYGSLLRSFSQSDLEADPIYQNTFNTALDRGQQGINRLAAAGGSLNSGATLKALTRFGAETANSYGNDAFNRFNATQTNQYNRLAGLSGAGQTAANTIGSAGANAANVISNNATSLGNARAASAIGSGNAINGGITNALGAYQNNQLINRLYPQSNGVGAIYNDINGSGINFRSSFR